MAVTEFKFSQNVQPSGISERIQPGIYKVVIKEAKDVTKKNKEGEEYMQAEFRFTVDPSEGVKGSSRLTLSYPNPEDPEGGTAEAWLSLWMWYTGKSAAETKAVLAKKAQDPIVMFPAKKLVVGVNVYETTYTDKKSGEQKTALRVWPLGPDAFKEAKAEAAANAKGGGKKKAAAADDDFELEDEPAVKGKGKAAVSDDSDDDLGL